MTVREYMTKKNEILFAKTGVILVPDEQIVDVEFDDKMDTRYDGDACPYCMIYSDGIDCKGCPMDTAGNTCGTGNDNTYSKVIRGLSERGAEYADSEIVRVDGIEALVQQWNEELDNKGLECTVNY